MVRKFDVPATVFRSRSFLGYRRFARNAAAIRVSGAVRLTFNHGWFPDREWNAAGLYPVERSGPCGAELLDILSGMRSGLAQHFPV